MTRRNAIPGDDDVALCAAVTLPEGAPEWVQLLQAGVNPTAAHSGPFTFDPASSGAVIAQSLKASPDGKLVIDLNHATDLAAPQGQPAPAMGWIEELEARADGLWGRVAWTAAGTTALNNREYRFISPVIRHGRKDGRVTAVLRASLTNNPNMPGLKPVLHHTAKETDMDFLKALNAALGLAETADEQAAIAAVKQLKDGTALNAGVLAKVAKAARLAEDASEATVLNAITALADPAKTVPAASFAEVQTALNAATTRLKALEDGGRRNAAEAFVDGAIRDGRAGVKPSRDHFVALHMADPAATEQMINGFPKITGTVITQAQPGNEATALNSAETEVAKLLGLKPEEMAKTRKQIEEAH